MIDFGFVSKGVLSVRLWYTQSERARESCRFRQSVMKRVLAYRQ